MGNDSAERQSELAACSLAQIDKDHFNTNVVLPHGLTVDHIHASMNDFSGFLGFINTQLHMKTMPRMESFLMPANFSSIVGEFMTITIPKYCMRLAKNAYHNGHPDLVPTGKHAKNSVQYGDEGVEVKASRYLQGWQGHNPEDVWLMVFVFESGRPTDEAKGVKPAPFRFLAVCGAQLTKNDWSFAGRTGESRRTITASVKPAGRAKMVKNWIY